jgi:hypothetical protein
MRPDSGTPRLPDLGQEPMLDAGADSEVGQTTLGAGVDACAEDDSSPVVMIPEFLTVFQHSNSACRPLGSGVLFRNDGTTSLRIEGVQASSPEFTLVGGSFPVDLAAGAFFPLRIYYQGTQEGPVEARLTFATGDGCRGFRIRGLRTPDTLVTRTHEAIDFGRLDAGATSEPRRLSVLTESAPESRITYHAFGVDPPGPLEIVAATSPEAEVMPCETRDVTIRLHAPLSAGPFEGSLLWRVTISTPQGDGEGTMSVPLYALINDAQP